MKRKHVFRRSMKGKDNRSLLIMINAGLVLIIIIIAMIAQLVRLNSREKKLDEQQKQAKAVAEQTVAPQTPQPTQTPQVERIRKDLDPEKPMVALTFDDGPYTKVTRRIVKALAKKNGRATFFVVGSRVPMYSDTLKYAYEHGNQIGTHTYSHKDLRYLKKKGIQKEVNKSLKAVKKVTGEAPTMLRPPYGNVTSLMEKTIKLPMIYWSVDTEDWRSRNAKSVVKNCRNLQDGDIVLMHDLYPSTASAVEKLVPKWTKKGYQFVTLEELFYYKNIDAQDGKVYYSGRQ